MHARHTESNREPKGREYFFMNVQHALAMSTNGLLRLGKSVVLHEETLVALSNDPHQHLSRRRESVGYRTAGLHWARDVDRILGQQQRFNNPGQAAPQHSRRPKLLLESTPQIKVIHE